MPQQRINHTAINNFVANKADELSVDEMLIPYFTLFLKQDLVLRRIGKALDLMSESNATMQTSLEETFLYVLLKQHVFVSFHWD